MKENKVAIRVEKISKSYSLYERPIDRLKEVWSPRKKKYHRDFYALTDISFEVKKGETFGIIGRNGAGKSTLLKVITGVLTASSGNVTKVGVVASLLELGTGFNTELNGYENIFFYASLMGIKREKMQEKVQSILDFADIGEFIDQPVKTYSSGMFARLAFSVAINVEPSVLIVDEVLSVGDSVFQKKCVKKIKEMRDNGVTILFVSHDDYMLRNLCERALYLDSGRARYLGGVEKCLQVYHADITDKIENVESQTIVSDVRQGEFKFNIREAKLFNSQDIETDIFKSGEDLSIRFSYGLVGTYNGNISFVINLYRNDDVYIFGVTSIMDSISVVPAEREGVIKLTFPSLGLLSGKYQFRVAVNDETGLSILCEANPACEFMINDEFEAVGLFNLDRVWETTWNE